MILEVDDEQMFPELVSLCVNLATNSKNAEMMVQNNRLQGLVEKAFKNQNPLLMKIVRNISQHESAKDNFVVSTGLLIFYTLDISDFRKLKNKLQEFVGDFAMALTQSDCQDFVLEIIGVMGNLVLPDLDYSQILQRCNLIPWIRNNLVPGE